MEETSGAVNAGAPRHNGHAAGVGAGRRVSFAATRLHRETLIGRRRETILRSPPVRACRRRAG